MRLGQVVTPGFAVALLALAALSGCQAYHASVSSLERPVANAGLLLMPLNIQLSEVTAGGVPDPKPEWTASAIRNVTAAMEDIAQAHDRRLVIYGARAVSDEQRDLDRQLINLYAVTGAAIQTHLYLLGQQLPTKDGRLNWSLGPAAASLRRETGADYGLFVYVRDSYASAGRAAMVAGDVLFTAVTGVSLGVSGGSQVGSPRSST
jgi:hypothetical protein